jgi:hypothetical protein
MGAGTVGVCRRVLIRQRSPAVSDNGNWTGRLGNRRLDDWLGNQTVRRDRSVKIDLLRERDPQVIPQATARPHRRDGGSRNSRFNRLSRERAFEDDRDSASRHDPFAALRKQAAGGNVDELCVKVAVRCETQAGNGRHGRCGAPRRASELGADPRWSRHRDRWHQRLSAISVLASAVSTSAGGSAARPVMDGASWRDSDAARCASARSSSISGR